LAKPQFPQITYLEECAVQLGIMDGGAKKIEILFVIGAIPF